MKSCPTMRVSNVAEKKKNAQTNDENKKVKECEIEQGINKLEEH